MENFNSFLLWLLSKASSGGVLGGGGQSTSGGSKRPSEQPPPIELSNNNNINNKSKNQHEATAEQSKSIKVIYISWSYKINYITIDVGIFLLLARKWKEDY